MKRAIGVALTMSIAIAFSACSTSSPLATTITQTAAATVLFPTPTTVAASTTTVTTVPSSARPTGATVVPNPTSTTPAAGDRTKELSADDGTQDGGISLGGRPQYGFLVRYGAGTPFVVTRIRIFSWIKGTPTPGLQFTVRITDKDLAPLWTVSQPMTLFTVEPSWLEITVPDIATNGSFCVQVYAPTLGEGLGPFVGVDQSGPNHGSELLSVWQIVPWTLQTARDTTNFMIRVVGSAVVP
jgi:hypothetical protein